MRAVRYHEHGDESVLTPETVDRPDPAPGEALVKVEAASVNPIDTYVREGHVAPPSGLPHVGGSDLAGVVEAVGDGVTAVAPGDRVFATGLGLFSPGTYAEYTVAPVEQLAPLPEAVSFRDGAAAAMAFATAWRALVTRGDLRLGDVALIHGASGGVGHAAVQVAVAAGATVVGTARDGDPAAFARELGADAVVDYRSEDLEGDVAAATDGRAVDVVFEPQADAHLSANLARLARGGRIVVIGENGPITLDGGLPMAAKKADADLRFMSVMASPGDQAPILERVGERLADGTFTVAIDSVFGLEAAAEAQAEVLSPGTIGKVVLDTSR
ncbi:NADPH:quinone reductase [Halorubrum sp. AD140]|uniref:NADPH:quinone reductase n=1 Tax=Halorubrum sp. AD140 TaxID=3050073 RepID=UPI002ACD1593|nr:NADPH:quinone reductase [Halorubrum sp. AD140]MDZ5809946.1 NADPH:quinone reductase [Halorubrum sp. AD140]